MGRSRRRQPFSTWSMGGTAILSGRWLLMAAVTGSGVAGWAHSLNAAAQGRNGRAGSPAKTGGQPFYGQNGRYGARPLQKMAYCALEG